MNSLERALIEKAGYDNGWEIVVESALGQVVLASALHRAEALIRSEADPGRWLLILPGGALVGELEKMEGNRYGGDGGFRANSDMELGRLLRHAARLARSLPDLPEQGFHTAVERGLAETVAGTEVERLVRQRVGQDIFRESLMDYWGGACAVTGIAIPELLRASHAKPWVECASDAERLNVFNGFLLAAHLDTVRPASYQLRGYGDDSLLTGGHARCAAGSWPVRKPRIAPDQSRTCSVFGDTSGSVPSKAWHAARRFNQSMKSSNFTKTTDASAFSLTAVNAG